MLAMTATPTVLRETNTNVLPMPLKGRSTSEDILIEGPAFSTASVYAPREDLFLEGDEASHLLEVVEGVVCA